MISPGKVPFIIYLFQPLKQGKSKNIEQFSAQETRNYAPPIYCRLRILLIKSTAGRNLFQSRCDNISTNSQANPVIVSVNLLAKCDPNKIPLQL